MSNNNACGGYSNREIVFGGSNLVPGQSQHNGGALFVRYQSDLCRSVSASVGPVAEGEQEEGGSALAILNGYTNIIQ